MSSYLCLQWVEAREKFEAAANLIDAEHRMRKTMWGQFWSAHQRFFKYLCISAKVHHCVRLANDAVRSGKVSSLCFRQLSVLDNDNDDYDHDVDDNNSKNDDNNTHNL